MGKCTQAHYWLSVSGFTLLVTAFKGKVTGTHRTSVVDGELFQVCQKESAMRPDRTTPRPPSGPSARRRQGWRQFRAARRTSTAGIVLVCGVLASTAFSGVASAATAVQLSTAAPFAILAGSAITDVPTSSITGNVGLSPAAGSFDGLTQPEVTGTIYSVDASGPVGSVNNAGLVNQAKNDLTTAYNTAAADVPTTTYVSGDNQLGGKTLTPGVYAFGHASTANITAASPLVLNGGGDVNAVFVFQASSDLVTASNSVVQLVNGAQACNVFWQVTSSATLNSSSTFVGTIMALTSATLLTGATVQGRVLARNGDVTLQSNTITAPSTCLTSTPATTTTTTAAGGSPTTTAAGVTAATGAPTATTTPPAFTGSGGSAAGATPVATSAAIVPAGSPGTGGGGAAHARSVDLLGLGALSLAGAAGMATLVARRRRSAGAES